MKKKMRNAFFRLLIIASVIVGIVTCSHREVFFHYHSFAGAEWKQEAPAVFNVKIDDHSQAYDVSIALRNSDAYPFRNIWLSIDYRTPDGNSRTDTISAELADGNGNWYGKGLSLYNLSIPYKTAVLFPDTGIYIYSIRPMMQENPLRGISDIGLKVSKKPVE